MTKPTQEYVVKASELGIDIVINVSVRPSEIVVKLAALLDMAKPWMDGWEEGYLSHVEEALSEAEAQFGALPDYYDLFFPKGKPWADVKTDLGIQAPSSLADATSPSALSERDFIEDYWTLGWRDFDPKWGRMKGEKTPALFHRLFPTPTPAALPASSPEVGREGMAKEIHKFALNRGWWNFPLEERVGRLLDWLIEEATEAKKAYEETGLTDWYSADSEGLRKPEGVKAELADIWLIWHDLEQGAGFPMNRAIREKLDYAKVRKYKRDAGGDALTPEALG